MRGCKGKSAPLSVALPVNQPNADDPLDVLSKLGGLDIAGLCGVFLGGALYRVPIIMDGFISGVAALCAVRLCENAKKQVFASHVSSEPAAHLVLNALGKKPLLTAGMHLGEGTGAVASIPLWDMAIAVYQGCYSFRRAASSRISRNADAGNRRFGKRKEQFCRTGLPCKAVCRVTYVATMHVWDAESEKRVARHREMRREKRFETLECPFRLDELIGP